MVLPVYDIAQLEDRATIRSFLQKDECAHGVNLGIPNRILHRLRDNGNTVVVVEHEETIIRALSDLGIDSWAEDGLTGVWTAKGKIAAIGVRVRGCSRINGVSVRSPPRRYSAMAATRLSGWRISAGSSRSDERKRSGSRRL